MRKFLMWLVIFISPITVFAHGDQGGFSLDLMVGQAFPEGSERTDNIYSVGLDYKMSDCWTFNGRYVRTVIDGDTFASAGQISFERHLHWGKRFDPFFLLGAGVYDLSAPDTETEIIAGGDCHDYLWGECEPSTKTVTERADESYITYHGGIGFDLKFGDTFGLTADARYVKPLDTDEGQDTVQVLAGVILDLGR